MDSWQQTPNVGNKKKFGSKNMALEMERLQWVKSHQQQP